MKHAVYVGTRNLYRDMMPAIKSILINSDVDKVHLLIEDDEFPYYLPKCVETINVSNQPYFRHDGPNFKLKWTYMTLMRAALPKIFPDIDVILSMDDDVIALGDVSPVWDLPIEDYYFAACREPKKSQGGSDFKFPLYTQMGVVLFNLKKLREDGMCDKVIDTLNSRWFSIAEQDCMNELCQGHIYPMPPQYNYTNYTEQINAPKMIHYAAIKNWTGKSAVVKYRQIPWSKIRGGI